MSIDTLNKKLDETTAFFEAKTKELEGKNKARVNVRLIHIPFGLIFGILWAMGFIVAKGFWATLVAFFIPFVGPAVSVFWLLEKFAGVH